MKKMIALNFLAVLTLATAVGCYQDPSKKTKLEMDRILRENEEAMKNIKVPDLSVLETGGQPGDLTLAGALIGSDGKVDDRIVTEFKTGLKRDGKETPLLEKNRLKREATIKESHRADLAALAKSDSFIQVGCTPEEVARFVPSGSLREAAIDRQDAGIAFLSAKTVLLCGKTDFKNEFLLISAETLVLSHVQQHRAFFIAHDLIEADRLILIGENEITMKGTDVHVSPSLEISVAGSIHSEQSGTLKIKMMGADYKLAEVK